MKRPIVECMEFRDDRGQIHRIDFFIDSEGREREAHSVRPAVHWVAAAMARAA